ncbi:MULTISPECIES: hypothetical protein [Streptomyces]|uniref:DUF3040 domain-containing protein n=1 Tax=Streptomyces argyrophylli TaxID=2726118 RepID=A0A6M4PG75_9ACTN|nr:MULTISPECIES: hypothetical protein [Streptomyces]QJS08646.1 hypothetical protein HKX69_03145 [Streptomyces argyrophyllae]
MNESGTGTTATPVEERLRAALAARAQRVGPADLRPLRPPSGPVRFRRVPVRRAVAGVLVLAAVVALVFLTVRHEPARPVGPARSPHPPAGTPTAPVPSPVSPSTPQPSPSARQP